MLEHCIVGSTIEESSYVVELVVMDVEEPCWKSCEVLVRDRTVHFEYYTQFLVSVFAGTNQNVASRVWKAEDCLASPLLLKPRLLCPLIFLIIQFVYVGVWRLYFRIRKPFREELTSRRERS